MCTVDVGPEGFKYASGLPPDCCMSYGAGVGGVKIDEADIDGAGGGKGKIAEALTRARFGDEEVLTGALPGGMRDADDDADKAGSEPVGRVDGGTKMVVDGRIVEALTGAGVGEAKDVVAVREPEE